MQKKKTQLIIIAGPQSSGKSTTLKLIKKHFPKLPVIEETNQYRLISKKHMGGAFVTKEIEQKILEADIKITKNINRAFKNVVMETGIFHLVYSEYSIGKKETDIYLDRYLKSYNNFDPTIIFIDTKPYISWKRRKPIYVKRIKDNHITDRKTKKEMLNKYKMNIYNLYPLWLKYYKKIPFKKYIIKNSNKNFRQFCKEIVTLIKKLVI